MSNTHLFTALVLISSQRPNKIWSLVSCVWAAFVTTTYAACAQTLSIIPDGTTQTSLLGSSDCSADCTIVGGVRVGNNLFHSFSEFSIDDATTVTVLDQSATNIFASVSNGPSLIEGTLAISGDSSARFFLFNPKGIEFGSHSTFSSSGSLIATTAESLIFSDGSVFSADSEAATPVLSISTPIGLQFEGRSGRIVNRSQSALDGLTNSFGEPTGLYVSEGQTIALLGNTVDLLSGNLTASSGQIVIASVDADSYVSFSDDLLFGYEETSSFQDISIEQRSILDVSGTGGRLQLRGRDISVAGRSALVNTKLFNGVAGEVSLVAERDIDFSPGVISFTVQPNVVGGGASLNIASENLSASNNSVIAGGTLGMADGGQADINVSGLVSLGDAQTGASALVTTSTQGAGRGGELSISARRLDVVGGTQVQSLTFGAGQGGNVLINAEQVHVTGSGTSFSGTQLPSGISASSGLLGLPFQPAGEGGSVTINANELTVDEGAQVAVNSLGAGDSGDLTINAHSIHLNNGSQLSAAAAFGNGGNIVIDDAQSLILRRGSLISTRAGTGDGTGDGGNITIGADFVVTNPLENSDIVAKATEGRGGNITIDALGLYGIAERRAIASNQTNDIDASSEFGVSGTIAINQLLPESAQPLLDASDRTIEVDTAVSQGCQTVGNRLVFTGSGGMPILPTDVANISPTLVDLGESFSLLNAAEMSSVSTMVEREQHQPVEAVLSNESSVVSEANGWQRDENNQVVLMVRSPQEQLTLQANAMCVG